MNLSDKELLNYAMENGMIDISTIQKTIEMNERKKYLEMHNHEVWKGKDGYFYTKVDDETKPGGRRMIKKSKREAVEDAIVDFYKSRKDEPTIESVFAEWVEQKIEYGEIQRQTQERYQIDFDRFFSEIKSKKIRYVTEEDLEQFVKLSIYQNHLKAKAWGNLRSILSGMFKFAKKRGYTNISITSFLGDLEISRKAFCKEKKTDEESVFTDLEMRKLVKCLHENPNIANLAILVAAYTGMRAGEVVALKWEDVNEKYIYVHRTQIRYREDGREIYEVRDFPKTEAGVRKIVIVENLKPILKSLRMMNPFTEYVFMKDGEVMKKCVPSSSLRRMCDKAGIPRRGMHVLRKTYATRLLNSNVDESVITNQMGHTDIATTKGHYYYNDKALESMADSIGKVINY